MIRHLHHSALPKFKKNREGATNSSIYDLIFTHFFHIVDETCKLRYDKVIAVINIPYSQASASI